MDPKIEELRNKIAKLEKEIGNSKEKSEKIEKKQFTPLKVLYKWTAAARVFTSRNKAWFLKISIIALLAILFFAFLQDIIVILVITVVVLITFLLSSIPPHKVEHNISNKGIFSIDTLYKWEDLKNFWVATKNGQMVTYVSTKLRFPTRLVMLITKKDESNVVKLLGTNLEYEEYTEKQGSITKLSDGEMVSPAKYVRLFKNKPQPKKQKVQPRKK